MATLTGYKNVSDPKKAGKKVGNETGQQNPVFVFDEVDVNSTTTNGNPADQVQDEFVDASSQPLVISSRGEDESTTKNDNPEHQVTSAKTPDLPTKHREPTATNESNTNNKQPAALTTTSQSSDNNSNNNLQQQQQQGDRKSPSNSLAPSRLNTNGGTDDDALSILAIDCSGKSPRQPRKSPLMALFRSKPRESVRRMYTDEDQFEIEWSNLSLVLHKKWYQRITMQNLLGPLSKQDAGDASTSTTGYGEDGKQQQSQSAMRPAKSLILNRVDGRIRSGEITAVLGPSGAGKTSLLNSLFGKYRTSVQGTIKVTGAPSKKHLTVCTIPQSDYLIGYLSTEESLWYASRLKNCEDDFDHDKNIERVVTLLGLSRCRHTRINKLSGGQYKRVSIAQEMLSSPDILVLDEPTSGLDSLTCYRTVKVLRDLVEASKAHNLVNPMSIILTIHQPHQEVLDLFHSVYVMAVGGMTLYQGPPKEMEECINKYSGCNMPAQGYNPASFMVELASEEYGRQPIETLVEVQREKFRQSTRNNNSDDNSTTNTSSNEKSSSRNIQNNSKEKETSLTQYKGSSKNNKGDSTITLYPMDSKDSKFVEVNLNDGSGSTSGSSLPYKDIDSRIMTPRSGKNSDGVFWRHVNLMAKRCFLANNRDPLLFTIRVGAHIFIPLVVALIYGPKMGVPNGCPLYQPEINLLEYASIGLEEIQEKHDDIRIQFQNVGLHFMVYYAFGLCMLAFTAISFPLIMHVLVKEIRNGWYSLATFILGKMYAELPMALILPPISVGIIYAMTGQPSSYLEWRYMVQSLLLILIVMIAEAKGLIFGALCMNSMQTAVFAASVSTVPFILLSGFLIRIREIPYILQHFARFSYFKHSVEALIITRYGFGMCPCDPSLIPLSGSPRIVGIPPQIMSLTDYYISAYVDAENSTQEVDPSEQTNVPGNNRNVSQNLTFMTTLPPSILEESETFKAESLTSKPTATGARGRQRRKRQTAVRNNSTNRNSNTRKPKKQKSTTTTTAVPTTTVSEEEDEVEEEKPQGIFFDKLGSLLTRANAFGYSIKNCDDVQPFTMKDMRLKDEMLPYLVGYLFLFIVILKFISYFIVEICIKLKL